MLEVLTFKYARQAMPRCIRFREVAKIRCVVAHEGSQARAEEAAEVTRQVTFRSQMAALKRTMEH